MLQEHHRKAGILQLIRFQNIEKVEVHSRAVDTTVEKKTGKDGVTHADNTENIKLSRQSKEICSHPY